MTKKEKDRNELQRLIEYHRKNSTEHLLKYSTFGGGNKVAILAMITVLKERGIDPKKSV